MSQASIWGMPTAGPADPAVVTARGNASLDALLSMNAGASAPAYRVQGTTWADTSAAGTISVKMWDGGAWRLLFSIATATGVITFAAPISKVWESAEQTITTGGGLTLAHNLGVKPSLITPFLVCKIAEAGYAVGDEIHTCVNMTSSAGSRFNSFYWDATSIKVRYSDVANCFMAAHASTGVSTQLTNANWRLKMRAHA